MTKEKLLEKIREDLIKTLSPNLFYSARIVRGINKVIDLEVIGNIYQNPELLK